MERHDDQLNRDGAPEPKSQSGWTSRDGKRSVVIREAAGVDCNEPWVASCDEHGEMLGCSTKATAIRSCKHRDWCSGCQKEDTATSLLSELLDALAWNGRTGQSEGRESEAIRKAREFLERTNTPARPGR